MNKTVLITGAAKGLGAATILEFAKHNYNVIINYLTSEKEAIELKNTIEKLYNTEVVLIKADITCENEVISMINTIKEKFNGIDVLINNAAYECDNNYLEKTKQEFMRVLEVNVVGTFLVTKYASMIMDGGTIINISSRDAKDTYNELSMDYCASKAGVNSLSQTFSLGVPNNKCISIMFPWINTEDVKEMFPEYLENELKRTGQKKLMEPEYAASIIYNTVNDNSIESGSIISI